MGKRGSGRGALSTSSAQSNRRESVTPEKGLMSRSQTRDLLSTYTSATPGGENREGGQEQSKQSSIVSCSFGFLVICKSFWHVAFTLGFQNMPGCKRIIFESRRQCPTAYNEKTPNFFALPLVASSWVQRYLTPIARRVRDTLFFLRRSREPRHSQFGSGNFLQTSASKKSLNTIDSRLASPSRNPL